ncbi:MAG: orotate phosphoribosyltransferase [Candidatus Eremiobacteraeota bacterium]|nr:orotate phosphoribosyltransferase [Candidatus Eremiobacteraeota bacterium]
MNAAASLLEELQIRGALQNGHFVLSSGRHSDRFVQKFRILEDPKLLAPLAQTIAERFGPANPTVVISAAVGGILLGYEVARALGTKAVFVEKEAGRAALRRGFVLSSNDRALVVEDVMTTGQSVGEVMQLVQQHGAEVIGVGAIVQRAPVDFGVATYALLDLPLESYDAAQCPQCKEGVPLVDPGSRRRA